MLSAASALVPKGASGAASTLYYSTLIVYTSMFASCTVPSRDGLDYALAAFLQTASNTTSCSEDAATHDSGPQPPVRCTMTRASDQAMHQDAGSSKSSVCRFQDSLRCKRIERELIPAGLRSASVKRGHNCNPLALPGSINFAEQGHGTP
jgi:hypothetical protein